MFILSSYTSNLKSSERYDIAILIQKLQKFWTVTLANYHVARISLIIEINYRNDIQLTIMTCVWNWTIIYNSKH